jgi:hypothetical protein
MSSKLRLSVLAAFISAWFVCRAMAAKETPQIMVDQFGWRPSDVKVAIFADPQKGQNASDRLIPGESFEVRTLDGKTALIGKLQPWNNGATDQISGDKVWWADLSEVKAPGRYVVYDPKNDVQSAAFSIREDVYNGVMRASMRTFYYQRCGPDIDAAHGGNWTHAPCHLMEKNTQERQAGKPAGGNRDLSGGWHDAGDHNKYVPFVDNTMWDLMMAYEVNPRAFTDDYNIPESGNGVPDILDEIKWELDWLLKMQLEDGSVINRVATISYNVGDGPDNDKQPYYYTPPTTWATAVFASTTAHAARLFAGFEKQYPGYPRKLQDSARKAWAYLETHGQMLPANGKDGAGQTAAAGGDGDANSDAQLRVLAAAELFKTTQDDKFRQYVDKNYKVRVNNGANPIVNGWCDPLNGDRITRAMVTYATTPGHTQSVADEFRTVLRNTLKNNFQDKRAEDAYRAWMIEGHYCWGSNSCKSKWGHLPLFGSLLETDPAQKQAYQQVAEEFVHYIHGRNAMSLVYLTNMGERGAKLGASRSVMEMFHGWFHDGSPLYDGVESKFGPAPGYLVGGPNKSFSVNWLSPPYGQPAAKSFKQWNTAWNPQRSANENSWEVTEPAIYSQAAYTLLLAPFVQAK